MAQTDAEKKKAADAKAKALKEASSTRITRCLRDMESVGNLNKFAPSQSQRKSIIDALRKGVDEVEKMINRPVGKKDSLFTLPD